MSTVLQHLAVKVLQYKGHTIVIETDFGVFVADGWYDNYRVLGYVDGVEINDYRAVDSFREVRQDQRKVLRNLKKHVRLMNNYVESGRHR